MKHVLFGIIAVVAFDTASAQSISTAAKPKQAQPANSAAVIADWQPAAEVRQTAPAAASARHAAHGATKAQESTTAVARAKEERCPEDEVRPTVPTAAYARKTVPAAGKVPQRTPAATDAKVMGQPAGNNAQAFAPVSPSAVATTQHEERKCRKGWFMANSDAFGIGAGAVVLVAVAASHGDGNGSRARRGQPPASSP